MFKKRGFKLKISPNHYEIRNQHARLAPGQLSLSSKAREHLVAFPRSYFVNNNTKIEYVSMNRSYRLQCNIGLMQKYPPIF